MAWNRHDLWPSGGGGDRPSLLSSLISLSSPSLLFSHLSPLLTLPPLPISLSLSEELLTGSVNLYLHGDGGDGSDSVPPPWLVVTTISATVFLSSYYCLHCFFLYCGDGMARHIR